MNIDIDQIAASLDDFSTHEEAREWFANRFGAQFIQKEEDISEGKRVYFYHIVKNRDAYNQYMASLMDDGKIEFKSMEPFESYSTVEISEDGDVSISI
ncbi:MULTISPECIES: hypothetical protein [Mesobacillus]|uniref:hypothetical protein n=1 Tax=Mesobacillus TaxID=2675231 RepID=UPI001786F28A|nr:MULTISPECIES: hypothetical protein [Mesobacillus]MCM3573624.1 hypothetical protein [Mesobacillus subterraneus]UYZ22850.1 hypothetical protein FOF60_04545 [Mesobacillus jeotgali]